MFAAGLPRTRQAGGQFLFLRAGKPPRKA